MSGQIRSIANQGKKKPAQESLWANHSETQQPFASRILALSGVLQTTLELNEMMALFAKKIRTLVPYDGLSYTFPNLKILIDIGEHAAHNASYNLMVEGEQLGELQFYRNNAFAESELETVENMMSGLLYPLRNALLYQRALESAVIDPLTGVKNRVAMDQAVRREVELAKRHNTPLSFILMDVDHFKAINDNHGHQFGDQVLKQVAQCAAETIRDSDIVFRYGGEEFLVLLTGTGCAGARLLAERIRENIEQMPIQGDATLHITASFGAACLRSEEAMPELFERMDKALYRAKDGGRNQVILAD